MITKPVYGVREFSLHGVMRPREEWLKGREQHEIREMDFTKTKDGEESPHYLGLLIDFTAGVAAIVYDVPASEQPAPVVEMHQPMEDWREKHPPRDDSPDAWRKAWEEKQAKDAAKPKPETAQA